MSLDAAMSADAVENKFRQEVANMTKPQKIAVFTKLECDSDFSYTKEAVRVLTESGIQVYINQNVKYRLGEQRDQVHLVYNERDLVETADMIVVLGGDGTMLDVCVHVAELAKPVVGVNLGHLGFLTAVEKDSIAGLAELAAGNFTVEERMMLDVEITTGFTAYRQRVLNDVVIATGVCSRMAEFELSGDTGLRLGYRADGLIVAVVTKGAIARVVQVSVYCDNVKATSFSGDGVIIATPTGSTAYSLSAGGPVVDPAANLIAVTPICPHTLLRGSVILSPETGITVTGRTRDEQTDIRVTTDGKNGTLVSCDTKIKIRKSDYTAKIVKIGANRFFDILETKLNQK